MFNLFNVTNILGVSVKNYSGYRQRPGSRQQHPGQPGYLRSSSFGQPVTTAGGVSDRAAPAPCNSRYARPSDTMSTRTLTRELTLPAATALVVGQVIAVGIFLTPGSMIRALASPLWVLVAWGLIGGMAMCGAVCYGALAARYPQAGGGYVYLREAYGPRVAFLYGWKCFLIMDPGDHSGARDWARQLHRLHRPARRRCARLVAIGAIVVLALVHMVGVSPGHPAADRPCRA